MSFLLTVFTVNAGPKELPHKLGSTTRGLHH